MLRIQAAITPTPAALFLAAPEAPEQSTQAMLHMLLLLTSQLQQLGRTSANSCC
jgi:hypothetical protein